MKISRRSVEQIYRYIQATPIHKQLKRPCEVSLLIHLCIIMWSRYLWSLWSYRDVASLDWCFPHHSQQPSLAASAGSMDSRIRDSSQWYFTNPHFFDAYVSEVYTCPSSFSFVPCHTNNKYASIMLVQWVQQTLKGI